MSCFVLNQSEGRVSNVDLANQLFHNENTSNSCDAGKIKMFEMSQDPKMRVRVIPKTYHSFQSFFIQHS